MREPDIETVCTLRYIRWERHQIAGSDDAIERQVLRRCIEGCIRRGRDQRGIYRMMLEAVSLRDYRLGPRRLGDHYSDYWLGLVDGKRNGRE